MIDEQNTPNPMQMPEASKEELRERQRATLDKYRLTAWANSVAARTGKPLTAEHKATLGASKRGRTPKRKIPLWPIAEDALLGVPTSESARKRGGAQPDFYRVRIDLGFPKGWPGALRHGEILTRLHVKEFCDDTGVKLGEAASFIGFGYAAFCNLVRKIPDRPLSSPHPKDPKSPHIGRLLRGKYDFIVAHFCYAQVSKRWRVRHFLRSEILKLPVQHAALMEAFEQLRGALDRKEMPAKSDEVLEWVCREARLENAKQKRRVVRLLLFFGLPFRELLEKNPEIIAETEGRVSRLYWPRVMASRLLANEYGAAESRIDDVVEAKETTPLDPRLLCQFLQKELATGPASQAVALSAREMVPTAQPIAAAPVPAESKGSGGRKKITVESNMRYWQLAKSVDQELKSMTEAMDVLRIARKKSPSDQAAHKRALVKAGYNEKQIAALLGDADTAIGAAQRYVALLHADKRHPHGLRLQTVQAACSRRRTYLKANPHFTSPNL